MRSHPLRILTATAALAALSLAPGLHAQVLSAAAGHPEVALVIEDPGPLRPGTTHELTLRLRGAPEHPVLLTPSVEGVALAVARGRLLRSDARASSAEGELRFALPLQLHEPGTAIIRVEALTYRCAARCVAVRVGAQRTLVVQ